MKFKFKKLSKKQKDDFMFKACGVCCLVGKKECITAPCGGGYMVEIKRPSKHERLLKALLKSGCVMDAIAQAGLAGVISNQQHNEIIAIKERIEKGGTK
jgi:hypothetical protein